MRWGVNSVLGRLCEDGVWQEFLEYKLKKALLDKREAALLRAYVENRRYRQIAAQIAREEYQFSDPQKCLVNKMGTQKKRVVYTFGEDETMVLKLLAYLLYEYDAALPNNCYSFRQKIGAKNAFLDLARRKELMGLWCFKADIRNYFNSIDPDILQEILQEVVTDDPLCRLLLSFIQNDRACFEGKIVRERKGVMAGTPVAPFLANLYLKEMDAYFGEMGAIYARYSDDIILFGTKEQIARYQEVFWRFLEKYKLQANPKKTELIPPGQPWTFLGFCAEGEEIDIAPITKKKIQDKIRRSARALYRWKQKKNAGDVRALKAMNRRYNRKFFGEDTGRELCWARWYFPVITTAKTLKQIDQYMQQWQRYLVTGRHNKKNHEYAPYPLLKACGYRSLVAEYYRYQKKRA